MLCWFSSSSKGIMVGLLSEDSDKRDGATVQLLGNLTCSVRLSLALLSCIVFSPVTSMVEVGPMQVMRWRI